jgi:putative acetyltransferase
MIRAYGSADLEAVVSVFHRSVHEVAHRDYSAAQLAAWAPAAPDLGAWRRRLETGAVFVFESAAGIAGFVRIDGTGCIDLLYVLPEAQRQGVARALMDRAVLWAVGRGIGRLHSDVSVTARPFFERVGFRVLREQVVERRSVSFHNVRMARDIDAGTSSRRMRQRLSSRGRLGWLYDVRRGCPREARDSARRMLQGCRSDNEGS